MCLTLNYFKINEIKIIAYINVSNNINVKMFVVLYINAASKKNDTTHNTYVPYKNIIASNTQGQASMQTIHIK